MRKLFCHSAESNGDFTLFVGSLLCRSVAECKVYGGNLQEADNSVGIVYMVICVFCKEFFDAEGKD